MSFHQVSQIKRHIFKNGLNLQGPDYASTGLHLRITPFSPTFLIMALAEIEQSALQLSWEERLQLARRLIESVGDEPSEQAAIDEGVRRIEDIATGKVRGLTEEEFLRAIE
jgi:putative addiction module component (TIGR02574 family)